MRKWKQAVLSQAGKDVSLLYPKNLTSSKQLPCQLTVLPALAMWLVLPHQQNGAFAGDLTNRSHQ